MSNVKPAYVELRFRPNVQLISTVRRFVSDFYEYALIDADTVSRLALATHELLENAVRNTANQESRVCIAVETQGGVDRVIIRTWNTTTPANVEILKRIFLEMNAAKDPFEYYQLLMKKTARQPDGSGLGLARIRCEAEMALGLEIVGEEVCISATAIVTSKG